MSHSDTAATSESIASRLDDAPVSKAHRSLFFRVAAGLFVDIFDLYIAAAIAGALLASGWATLDQLAPLAGLTLAGMMLGSLCAGFFGDRFGRRAAFRWSLVLVGVSSLAAALAPNVETLIAARFITGIGLGAEAVLAYAAFGEFLPKAVRARWLGYMGFAGNTAVIAAALAGYLIIPHFGWRWLFAIAAIGAVVAWWLRRRMPESPRWLSARGRHEEAGLAAEAIVGPAPLRPAVVQPVISTPIASTQEGNWLSFVRPMFVASVMNLALYVSIFAFLTWLPSIMVAEGRALPKSLLQNVLMSCGALVGTLASGWLADWLGRKWAVCLLALVAALLALSFGASSSTLTQTLIGFCLYASIYCLAVVSVSIYSPELFSTRVRLRGAGTAVAIGRAGAIAAPFVLPTILLNYGLPGAAMTLAIVLAFEIVVVLLFGRETRGSSLQ